MYYVRQCKGECKVKTGMVEVFKMDSEERIEKEIRRFCGEGCTNDPITEEMLHDDESEEYRKAIRGNWTVFDGEDYSEEQETKPEGKPGRIILVQYCRGVYMDDVDAIISEDGKKAWVSESLVG